jgi:hemolysin activation/secretion protein
MVLGGNPPVWARWRRRACAAAAVFYLSLCQLAAAQQPAPVRTPGIEPGQLEKRFEQKPVPQAPEAAPVETPVVREAPVTVEEAPAGVVLTGVDIEGATVYPSSELAELYTPLLATRITRTDIERLLDAITKKYRDDGYVLVRAIAPPQRLDLGVLRIRVIEGYVDRITFSGATPAPTERLQEFLRPITEDRPLQLSTLERHTLILGELPGVEMRAALRPIDEPAGIYELRVDLVHKEIGGALGLDNRGTQSVGPYQGFGVVDFHSVLGRLETTRLTLYTIPIQPKELVYGEVRHEEPIGSLGTRAGLSLSKSISHPGDDLRHQDVQSFSTRIGLDLRHPLMRARSESLYLTGQAYWSDAEQEVTGIKAFSDHIRAIGAGLRYNLVDSWGGQNLAQLSLVQGLPILNASDGGDDELSRPRGHGDFFKGVIELARQQQIEGPFAASITLTGQKAATTLLSGEEFALGGARFGRAYDPSEITGSNGAAGVVELQYNGQIPGLGPELTYQLYGFGDFGVVWNTDIEGGGVKKDSLASAGGGVRFGWGGKYMAEVEIAKPLTRGVASEGNSNDLVRVFFRLTGSF